MRGSLITRGVLAWAASGLLISLGAQLLFESYSIRGLLPILAWLAVGAALIARRLWEARRAETRRQAFASAGAVVFAGLVVVLLSPFVAQLGASIVESMRFGRNRSVYEQIVAEVERAVPPAGRYEHGDVPFLVDPGPPVRVAFPWPGGGIGGWCGAVHDRSGQVMRINDLPTDAGSDSLRKLFRGDMTDCHALAEEYYLCCFTLPGLEPPTELPES